jgi:ElaB/YqjD/DUF883 family membrane-anchored ribosome-binding protein
MAAVHQMKKQMREGADTLMDSGAEMLHTARETLGDLGENARNMARAGYEQLTDTSESLIDIIRQRPIASVLAAACLGCLVGTLLRRRD